MKIERKNIEMDIYLELAFYKMKQRANNEGK